MSDYELTETAKDELDFECSECGTTEHPEVAGVEDTRNPLADHRITVACVDCGNETGSLVWGRDIKEVTGE
jgi:ribosomal protein S27E